MSPGTVLTVSAPLRLSLGGGGCDLPEFYRLHGADVLSVAVDRRITITVEPCASPPGPDADPRVRLLSERLPHPVRVTVDSPVPPGSGLGGSGALTVALVAAEAVLRGADPGGLDPLAVGREAYRWERELLGEPVGFQDQMASAFGSVTRMRAAAHDGPGGTAARDDLAVERHEGLAAALDRMLGDSVRLFPTRQVRSAARQLAVFARNLAAGEETSLPADTPAFAAAVARCDGAEFGRLMRRRWEHKVALNPTACWPEAAAAIDDALAHGATGAKVVGAGGGGWLMIAGPGGAMPAVAGVLAHRHALTEDTFHVEPTGIHVGRSEST